MAVAIYALVVDRVPNSIVARFSVRDIVVEAYALALLADARQGALVKGRTLDILHQAHVRRTETILVALAALLSIIAAVHRGIGTSPIPCTVWHQAREPRLPYAEVGQ